MSALNLTWNSIFIVKPPVIIYVPEWFNFDTTVRMKLDVLFRSTLYGHKRVNEFIILLNVLFTCTENKCYYVIIDNFRTR